jgi:hypothetical protein
MYRKIYIHIHVRSSVVAACSGTSGIYIYIPIDLYIDTHTHTHAHAHTRTLLYARVSPQPAAEQAARGVAEVPGPSLFVCLRVCLRAVLFVSFAVGVALCGRGPIRAAPGLFAFVCLFLFVGPLPPVARRPNGWLRGRVVLGVLTPGHFRPPPNGRSVARSVCLQQILILKEVERARVRGLYAYVYVYRCRYRHMYIYAYISFFSYIYRYWYGCIVIYMYTYTYI